jgi:VanZ family protein
MDDLIADFVGAVIGIAIVAFAVIAQSHHRESTP